jgi:hypothetical protein
LIRRNGAHCRTVTIVEQRRSCVHGSRKIKKPPNTALRRCPGGTFHLRGRCDRASLLVLGERFEHELAHAVLRVHVGDGPQQRETAALTIDGVLARRERNVAAVATASLPDAEADQLLAVEIAVDEMQLGIGEFAGRIAFVVWRDFDDDLHSVTS